MQKLSFIVLGWLHIILFLVATKLDRKTLLLLWNRMWTITFPKMNLSGSVKCGLNVIRRGGEVEVQNGLKSLHIYNRWMGIPF